jgi:hypothetical protein
VILHHFLLAAEDLENKVGHFAEGVGAEDVEEFVRLVGNEDVVAESVFVVGVGFGDVVVAVGVVVEVRFGFLV